MGGIQFEVTQGEINATERQRLPAPFTARLTRFLVALLRPGYELCVATTESPDAPKPEEAGRESTIVDAGPMPLMPPPPVGPPPAGLHSGNRSWGALGEWLRTHWREPVGTLGVQGAALPVGDTEATRRLSGADGAARMGPPLASALYWWRPWPALDGVDLTSTVLTEIEVATALRQGNDACNMW